MPMTGQLRTIRRRENNWGGSYVLEVCDNALAWDGVRCGDQLVVDRGCVPDGDALVVIREECPLPYALQGGTDTGPRRRTQSRLLLRKMERFGPKVRLQPGSSPRRPLLLDAEQAGIWGTVTAVMRKFNAA